MHTDCRAWRQRTEASSNAVKMRFEEINAAGGIHGRKIN
jgi:ABC-type branched-subunit amino acid transport system substrate-binding protein